MSTKKEAAAIATAIAATTRGRKPQPPAVLQGPDYITATPADIAVQLVREQQAVGAYAEERDLVNQLLGQAQALSATSAMLQTFGISKLAFVKENKLYRALAGKTAPNGLGLQGTWEEFCSLLGMSDEKANQDIANLKTFGESALEQMSSMGIGYRELRQYRKLPADEKLALIEAAKSGDKDSLLDLAETLISRHAKEKETLTAERDEAQATAASRQTVIGDKEATISSLQEKLAGKKRETPELLAEAALRDIDQQALACVGEITACLRQKFVEAGNLASFAADRPLIEQAQRAAIGRVLAAVHQLADDYGIATLGADATPEAYDVAAEDEAIWAAVNAEMAEQQNESAH